MPDPVPVDLMSMTLPGSVTSVVKPESVGEAKYTLATPTTDVRFVLSPP